VEGNIRNIIGNVRGAQQASAQRIESEFQREFAFQEQQGLNQIQQHREGQVGFGTQMVALRNLVETTDKNLNDLKQRKEELLLAGEAEAAQQIANLELQALKFRQDALQKSFTNTISIAGLGIEMARESRLAQESIAQESRLERQLAFEQESAIAEIQLEFPEVTIPAGSTLEEALKIARPFALKDKEREQRLEEIGQNALTEAEKKRQSQIDNGLLLYGDLYRDLISQGLSPTEAYQDVLDEANFDGYELPAGAVGAFFALQPVEGGGSEITNPQTPAPAGQGTTGFNVGESTGSFLQDIRGTTAGKATAVGLTGPVFPATEQLFNFLGGFSSGIFR
jgi:hypothetical protein